MRKDTDIDNKQAKQPADDQMIQPYSACYTCPNIGLCPVLKAKQLVQNLRVGDPNKCVLEQMPVQQVQDFGIQLINLLSLNEVERVRLMKELSIIESILDHRGRIVTPK